MRRINLPLTKDIVKTFKLKEELLLSGPMLTGRDAAHKKLCEALAGGKKLPVSIKGETIYYTGPTPAKPGEVIGSCGPTTSARMDPFAGLLLENGLIGMIGKGERSDELTALIKRHGAVYFVTIGGAGAYLQDRIRKSELAAYKELDTEAIRRLIVEDFPVTVAVK